MKVRESAILEINKVLNQRLELALNTKSDLIQSQNEDTKSSAGDKYETGREMIQQELMQIETQIQQLKKFQHDLNVLKQKKVSPEVEIGSLVKTNRGWFFLGLSLGKIVWENETLYCISTASPIGKLLLGKTLNNKVQMGTQTYDVLEIW